MSYLNNLLSPIKYYFIYLKAVAIDFIPTLTKILLFGLTSQNILHLCYNGFSNR